MVGVEEALQASIHHPPNERRSVNWPCIDFDSDPDFDLDGPNAMLRGGACAVRGSNLFAEGVLFLAPTGRPHRSPGQRPISAKLT